MPEQILFPEFRDQYAATKYPFTDWATLQSQGTSHALDQDLFVDASLYPLGAVGSLYIASITVASRRVTLSIADGTRREKASVVFDPLEPPETLVLTDSWGRPAGILLADGDSLSRFGAWEIGTHSFTAAATTFVPSCFIPTPDNGVRGLLTAEDELFTEDALIVGDNGIVLRQDENDPEVIRVDIVGDPLFRRQLCDPISLFRQPTYIRTINGCPGDVNGNFQLTVGDNSNAQTIVRIYKKNGNLVIAAVGSTAHRTS